MKTVDLSQHPLLREWADGQAAAD